MDALDESIEFQETVLAGVPLQENKSVKTLENEEILKPSWYFHLWL